MPLQEILVFCQDATGSKKLESTDSRKPVSDFPDGGFMVATMCLNVTSGEIGDRRLIAIRLFLEYQNDFLGTWFVAKVSASKVDSKLKWHIEPVVFARVTGLTSAKVVNRES